MDQVWWPHDSFAHHTPGSGCSCNPRTCVYCGGVDHVNTRESWCESCRTNRWAPTRSPATRERKARGHTYVDQLNAARAAGYPLGPEWDVDGDDGAVRGLTRALDVIVEPWALDLEVIRARRCERCRVTRPLTDFDGDGPCLSCQWRLELILVRKCVLCGVRKPLDQFIGTRAVCVNDHSEKRQKIKLTERERELVDGLLHGWGK